MANDSGAIVPYAAWAWFCQIEDHVRPSMRFTVALTIAYASDVVL
jgi:hypothetical protein